MGVTEVKAQMILRMRTVSQAQRWNVDEGKG